MKSPEPITTLRENSKVLKKQHYAPPDDTESLSGHVYISGWRKFPKPITNLRENSKVLKKHDFAPANDTEALSGYVYVFSHF